MARLPRAVQLLFLRLYTLYVLYNDLATALRSSSRFHGNQSWGDFTLAMARRRFLSIEAQEVADVALRLIGTGSSLYLFAPPGTLTAPTRMPWRPPPPTRPRTFHPFPRLPAELQVKIWKAAALPPMCKHYYEGNAQSVYGFPRVLLVRKLMPDHGLWRACRVSRWEVKKAYERARKAMLGHAEKKPEKEGPVVATETEEATNTADTDTTMVDAADTTADTIMADAAVDTQTGTRIQGMDCLHDSDRFERHYFRLSQLNYEGSVLQLRVFHLNRRLLALQRYLYLPFAMMWRIFFMGQDERGNIVFGSERFPLQDIL